MGFLFCQITTGFGWHHDKKIWIDRLDIALAIINQPTSVSFRNKCTCLDNFFTKLNPQQFKAKDQKTTAFLFLANYYRVFTRIITGFG
jgi:hypothetical protein